MWALPNNQVHGLQDVRIRRGRIRPAVSEHCFCSSTALAPRVANNPPQSQVDKHPTRIGIGISPPSGEQQSRVQTNIIRASASPPRRRTTSRVQTNILLASPPRRRPAEPGVDEHLEHLDTRALLHVGFLDFEILDDPVLVVVEILEGRVDEVLHLCRIMFSVHGEGTFCRKQRAPARPGKRGKSTGEEPRIGQRAPERTQHFSR